MMQVTLAKFSRRIAGELLKNVFRESLESVPETSAERVKEFLWCDNLNQI